MGGEKIAGCTLDLPTDTLSAWRDRALSVDEAERVGAHVPGCAACRTRLAEYEAVAHALRALAVPEPVGGYGHNPRRRDADHADRRRPHVLAPPRALRPARSRGGVRPRLPIAVEVIAALLLIALLGGLLGWQRSNGGPAPVPTATPPRDPATQAYVHVLRTDYPPFVAAEQAEYDQCGKVPASHFLAPCRPLEVAAIAAAQTLLGHLTTTPAPAGWRAWDTALKQALQAAIAYNTKRIQAIDANDARQFQLTRDDGNAAGSQLCAAILQIDKGPPPLAPSIPLPAYAMDPQRPGCLPV
jgi:hypothetical protein